MTELDIDLERRLVALARMLDDGDEEFLLRVMGRVGGTSNPAIPWHRRTERSLLVAAAIVIAVLVGAALIVPASRHAVAHWFGIGNTEIQRPTPSAPSSSDAPPVSFPASLDLGDPVAGAEAEGTTGLAVPVAIGLGDPVGVFVVRPPNSGQIVVVYPPSDALPATPIEGIGALLSAAAGRLDDGLYLKVAAAGTTVTNVTIMLASGVTTDAIYLSGEPHQYVFEASNGEIVYDTLRLATNTLLWSDGDIVHRLESQLTLDQAMAIVATVSTG
ncbi:MAG: hypothetical protein ABIR32_17670 [Ilumatobacteraceae bacterium]